MKRSEHFNVVAGHELYVVDKGDVSGIFTVVFSYLDSDGKIAHCYSDKGMYRVREEVAFEHWLSRGFMYNAESNTLCPISYELTDNSYVFYCSDEPVSVLANWKIGTYSLCLSTSSIPTILVKVCSTML